MLRALVLATLFVGFVPSAARGPLDREPVMAAIRLVQGPGETLASVDVDLIDRARREIDLAAYVLTDHDVGEALQRAARRGVRVRIYLDPDQAQRRGEGFDPRLEALARVPQIAIRFKSPARDSMHLKAYHVDGRFLRTGSANLSFTGLRRQDNDVLVIESRDLAGAFAQQFDRLWTRSDNTIFHP
jgi:phosphatidylserine/phosphatidylglycerophosphate/cardiolipin synthase-like enzyme